MIGHTLTSSGAIEAVFSVQTMRTGVIPPTINYKVPDPTIDARRGPQSRPRAEGLDGPLQFLRLRRPERLPDHHRGAGVTLAGSRRAAGRIPPPRSGAGGPRSGGGGAARRVSVACRSQTMLERAPSTASRSPSPATRGRNSSGTVEPRLMRALQVLDSRKLAVVELPEPPPPAAGRSPDQDRRGRAEPYRCVGLARHGVCQAQAADRRRRRGGRHGRCGRRRRHDARPGRHRRDLRRRDLRRLRAMPRGAR